MSIQDWAIAASAKGLIRDCEKDGRIAEAVVIVESAIKGIFPGDLKTVKQMLVQYVIFPFCKQLMKGDDAGYQEAKKVL